MHRLLLQAALIPVLVSLLGLHSRRRGKGKRSGGEGGQKSKGEYAKKELDKGDLDESGDPADDTPQSPPKKPKKPKPQFKADKGAREHAWNDHKPGSAYDRDGKHGNIWHDDMTEERLNEMIDYVQNPDPGRVQVNPRNPTDPRAGHYYDYNTHDESNPTGRMGQTGIRIVVDGDGNMLTAMPYPHKDPDNPHGTPNTPNGGRRR